MSSSPEADMANGHDYSSPQSEAALEANGDANSPSHHNNSDPSDVETPDTDAHNSAMSPGSSHSAEGLEEAVSEDAQDMSSQTTGDEDARDADYDMLDSPAASSSSDSPAQDVIVAASPTRSTATKRKAVAVTDDEHMRSNPELYGLRRSSRPTHRKAIVESDQEDQDADETSQSDAVVTPKATKRRKVARSLTASKRPSPATRRVADDSDSDTYGGAKARSFRKKARRQKELQLDAGLVSKRWSSRRAAQLSAGAYQETEEDDEAEDEAQAMDVTWASVEDDRPYIERVLRHRHRQGLELRPNMAKDDFEFFVKWQGRAHLHNTWETIESASQCRGIRRVENYFRRTVEYDLEMRFGGDEIIPEQREQWLLDREREEQAFENYLRVERVVMARDGDHGEEYFIKWKGLQYDECTWESGEQVRRLAPEQIAQFVERSSRSWQSDRKEANIDSRSRMTKLEKQPSYIRGGELREFQMKGLNFLALNWTRGSNVILADEMGLGKTVQSVAFLSWLRNARRQEGPFLVVAPLSVIPAWCDTFNNWSPDLNYAVYLGPESARANIRAHELLIDGNPRKPKFNVLVTSYEYILLDHEFFRSIKWQVLAVDEAHRLKNSESQLYQRLSSFGVPCKVLITGTPIQNNLAELSALLNFLNPGKVLIDDELDLLSHADGGKDKPDEELDEEMQARTQAKLCELHATIAPYILRRTKETVESDLPPKTEKIIRVELSDVQLEYYKNILTRNYAALSDASNGYKQSLLNIMMELKKVSNHPYMFTGAEERILGGSTRREDQIKGLITSSGKMMLLDQLLAKLRKDNHRVLIFSQMVKMLDILGDYLRIRGYQFQRLDGTIPDGPRRMAINHFNAEGSEDFCFLLSTRAGGLGINLMTADTVIIYDSDWNPQADLQAMARAHRIGQKKPVNVYRLVAKQTVEEEVVKRARNKLFLEYLTIQAGVTDEGRALREQFKERGVKFDEAKTSEDIQMILKMRSQNLFEQSGNQEKLEHLDIDSILENAEVTKTNVDDKINLSSGGIDWDNWMQVTDVKVDELALDWDQIIPAEELAVIKAEEEHKLQEEYLTKAMEENAPRRATLKNRNQRESERAERAANKIQRQKREQEEMQEQKAKMVDPKRPLNEKETRNLIRAISRYGSMEGRENEIVQEARLMDRDPEFIRGIIADLMGVAREAVEANQAKVREEEERAGKPLAKKDKKAVLIDFGEVRKVNAETLVERPPQLQLLRKVLQEHGDPINFRLSDATKAASYTCEWGAREDGMLLVGINRYGFGAWSQIRDDADLAMHDKFFLEEHRVDKKEERRKADDKSIQSPGAVHLVRRSEYLLSVLQAKHSNDAAAKKAVENHHRSKKHLANGHRASPAASSSKKVVSQAKDLDRYSSLSSHRASGQGSPRTDNGSHNKRKHEDHDERGHANKSRRIEAAKKSRQPKLSPEELDRLKHQREKAVERFVELSKRGEDELGSARDEIIWSLLRPVKSCMEKIMYSKERFPSCKDRAQVLGEEIRVFGSHLERLKKNKSGDARDKFERLQPEFWEFLSSIWPLGDFVVPGKRLQKMYGDLVDKDKRAKRDVEDGEIVSDRDDRRAYREAYLDDRRRDSFRRDEWREDKTRRNNYYDDRLNFSRHRDRRDSHRPDRPTRSPAQR